jgi:hypothetical protein
MGSKTVPNLRFKLLVCPKGSMLAARLTSVFESDNAKIKVTTKISS